MPDAAPGPALAAGAAVVWPGSGGLDSLRLEAWAGISGGDPCGRAEPLKGESGP
jgi:glycine cleavage system aminomethyltransferase T